MPAPETPFAVIVCTRNRSGSLARTLDALQEQAPGGFPVVVVDQSDLVDEGLELRAARPRRPSRDPRQRTRSLPSAQHRVARDQRGLACLRRRRLCGPAGMGRRARGGDCRSSGRRDGHRPRRGARRAGRRGPARNRLSGGAAGLAVRPMDAPGGAWLRCLLRRAATRRRPARVAGTSGSAPACPTSPRGTTWTSTTGCCARAAAPG